MKERKSLIHLRKGIASPSEKTQEKMGSQKLSLISLFILSLISQACLPNLALVTRAQQCAQ